MSVVIVDYGSGNLRSAAKAFERAIGDAGLKMTVRVTGDAGEIDTASHIVLPGVGAFGDCRRGLDALPGMVDALSRAVIEKGRPFLGICVGMQLMADRGREHGDHAGLGWIPGTVERLAPEDGLKIPHMGWNELAFAAYHPLFKGIAPGAHAYFVHSFAFHPTDPAHALASVDYGGPVVAVIGRDNLAGTQFHPEKSQRTGLTLIANFLKVAAMILYPAIDLKDGRCVRLRRGEMATATIFNDDPADQARRFAAAGCRWLHLVDLDGAFAGRPVNAAAVDAILAAVAVPVQLGGGIREMATIEAWLERGVARVILGSAAVRDPELVRQAARAFPGRIAVGLDARRGMVATDGWAQSTALPALELARRFEDDGIAALIYTDIDHDGVLTGVNVEATAGLARAVAIPVIASGGVAGLEDLAACKAEAVIAGVICGRALYDGRIDLPAALAVVEERPLARADGRRQGEHA